MQNMKLYFSVSLALALAGCQAAPSPQDEAKKTAEIATKSNALADQFQKQLQTQLKAGLESGGPIAALDVCHSAAPSIAQSLSEESGATIRRISAKPRNPNAAVTGEWADKLAELAKAPMTQDGKPATLQWTTGEGAATEHHFLRAVNMQEKPCAACHGTNVAPEVKAKIDALYPNDTATGYTPGQMRGAIAISWTEKGAQ